MNLKKSITKLSRNWLNAFIDGRRVLGISGLPRYFGDWKRFSKLAGRRTIRWYDSYPCLSDWISQTPFDRHYFYQAYWFTHKIVERKPLLHVDVGSSVTIISTISAVVSTVFLDLRPLRVSLPGLSLLSGDLLSLPFSDGSLPSLSCLHVIEHIGLGRYGDFLDPGGSVKAAQELDRVLAPGGRLLLSTPVGREGIQFNAHRIFAPATVISMFGNLELVSFDLVDDEGIFRTNVNTAQASECEYACGMFEFVKQFA